MIAAVLAALTGPAFVHGTPPCPIPRHALVLLVQQPNALNHEIDIYDRVSDRRTCTVELPGGYRSKIAVLSDGRIVVSVASNLSSGRTTDRGEVDVLGPDGRLLDRLTGDAGGPWDVAADAHEHFFVGSGESVLLNGQLAPTPGALRMYDGRSLKLLRSFDVEPNSFAGEFALSPDGQTIAALLTDRSGSGTIDVLDVATGMRKLRIPLTGVMAPAWVDFDGPNLLVAASSPRWQVRSIATGDVIETPTMTDWIPPVISGGISYEKHEVSSTALASAGPPTFNVSTSITRRDVSTGRALPAIVLSSWVNGIYPVDPNPELAAAVPGPELRVPVFPSLAEIRASVPAKAGGLEFDDAVSGKHFSYRAAYARIDDPSARRSIIVDCARGLALVADEGTRTYRVLRMDATTIDDHVPVDAFTSHLRPPASATLTIAPIDPTRLKSSLATSGYTARLSFAPFGAAQPAETFAEEQEFTSSIPAVHPSCARHTFDGQFLEIEPHLRSDVPSAADMPRAFPPEIVSVIGQAQPLPITSLRVHAESLVGTQHETIVDLQHVRTSAVAPDRFAPPAGFLQDTSTTFYGAAASGVAAAR